MKVNGKHYRTVWMEDDKVKMIEQRNLPDSFDIIELKNVKEVADAISRMSVRGAGAIGGTAGYGMAVAALNANKSNFDEDMERAKEILDKSRPTAQNLFYATKNIYEKIKKADSVDEKIT
ncbi:MAG: S-methyl-5-thioribose-1-phosphate isomerase, partial [Candidatus Aenigmatarchaeota archaeon]